MTGIPIHNSQLNPICLVHTEKIADAVFLYIFKMVLPASLKITINFCKTFTLCKITFDQPIKVYTNNKTYVLKLNHWRTKVNNISEQIDKKK